MLRKLNQKGFSMIEGLLILVILSIVAFTGYYVWHSNQKTANTFNQASQAAQSSPAKVTKKIAAPADATANWTAFTSQQGKFSLKYPSSWVQPVNQDLCSADLLARAIYLGPDSASVLHCGSEDFGQMSVVSTIGDQRTKETQTFQTGYTNIQLKDVYVDKIAGSRTSATAKGQQSNDNPFGLADGTTVVKYVVYTNSNTYVATYTQTTKYQNVLSDFDLMITKTLQFN